MEALLKTFDLTLMDGMMVPIVAVFFVIFWWTLRSVLFDPFLNLIETRERLTDGALTTANDVKSNTAQILEEYNSRIFNARAENMKSKLTDVANAKAEASQIIQKAEDEVQELVRNERWQIQQNISELRKSVLGEADSLAKTLVEKVTSGPL